MRGLLDGVAGYHIRISPRYTFVQANADELLGAPEKAIIKVMGRVWAIGF